MSKSDKLQVNFQISRDHLGIVDELAENAGMSRSAYLRESALNVLTHFCPSVRTGIERMASVLDVDARFLCERILAEHVAAFEACRILTPDALPDTSAIEDPTVPPYAFIERRRGELVRVIIENERESVLQK